MTLQIKSASGESEIECDCLVNAGGPWAAEVAFIAGIGKRDHSSHVMRTKLPVEPRLRSVFVFKCPTDLPDCPLVIDRHYYWRRESAGTFLAGFIPPKVRGYNSKPTSPFPLLYVYVHYRQWIKLQMQRI